MRIGLMVGSDKERPRADRLAGLLDDGMAAEAAGFASFWFPQVPGYLDAMTAVALLGQATSTHRNRNRGRPDPDPPSDDPGAAGADHPGGLRRPIHARPRPVAPLDHPRPAGDCPTTDRPGWSAITSTCWTRRSPVPAPVDVDNDSFRVHSPIDVTDAFAACRCCSPRSDRRCCGSPANAPTAPSCGWPTSGRSATTSSRASPTRPNAAGRPAPRIVAGVPVALCADERDRRAPATYASEVLGHADFSPNYVRLLEHGDAEDVGDTMAAGDESTVAGTAAPLPRRRRHRSRRTGGPARRRAGSAA